MSGFTPGPWRVCQEGDMCPSVDAGDDFFVVAPGVWGETVEQEFANARLIAAAPTLLHCLKVILDHAEGREDWEVALHLDKAREAVAKAEGKA